MGLPRFTLSETHKVLPFNMLDKEIGFGKNPSSIIEPCFAKTQRTDVCCDVFFALSHDSFWIALRFYEQDSLCKLLYSPPDIVTPFSKPIEIYVRRDVLEYSSK